VYGSQNREPAFWRAVALWRASRADEAREAIAELARGNPGWAVLFEDVVSRWPVP